MTSSSNPDAGALLAAALGVTEAEPPDDLAIEETAPIVRSPKPDPSQGGSGYRAAPSPAQQFADFMNEPF